MFRKNPSHKNLEKLMYKNLLLCFIIARIKVFVFLLIWPCCFYRSKMRIARKRLNSLARQFAGNGKFKAVKGNY